MIGLASVEGVAYAMLRSCAGASIGELDARRRALLTPEGPPAAERLHFHLDSMASHPYVGFVRDPTRDRTMTPEAVTIQGTSERIPARRHGRVIVGVLGGSVAYLLGNLDAEPVRRIWSEALGGREVVLVVAATPGWKQPQSLQALAWLLVQGFRFDVILELDGYNEVANAAANALWFSVHPAYPYDYRAMMASAHEGPEYQRAAGVLTLLGEQRAARARWLDQSLLGRSPTANLVWWSMDQADRARADEARETLRRLGSESEHRYDHRGPRFQLDGDALYEELARLWRESARQMSALARGHGAGFLLALQPNQYVPGSKPFSDAERELALTNEVLREQIPRGYPRLQREARTLSAEGIGFVDLTRIFANDPEPAYSDWCCHLNARGNLALARSLAAPLAEAYASSR